MKKLLIFAGLMLMGAVALAAAPTTPITCTGDPAVCARITINVGDLAPPLPPINAVCTDNGWSNVGGPIPTACPASGMQTQAQQHTWTQVSPPQNGGTACPTAPWPTRTIPVTCTPPVPLVWSKFAIENWPNPPQQFTVNKRVEIRYGVDTFWNYKTFDPGVTRDCDNDEFGNPAGATNRAKECQTQDLTAVTAIPIPSPVPDADAVCESNVTTQVTACMNGQQTVTTTTTWTQIKPPTGNGKQCPATTVTTETKQCGGGGIILAPPAPGFTTLRISNTTDFGAPNDIGAFRNPCSYSHMGYVDPIVYPGAQPGVSHGHTFFGNTSTNQNTNTASLDAANSSTCAGGIANESAYWVPLLYDTRDMLAMVPAANLIYYKSGYNQNPLSTMRAPPDGLRWITGNKPTQASALPSYEVHHNFECWDSDGRHGTQQTIPDKCKVGGYILMILEYQNCWDGVNLDSVDHRSHMAYSGGGACPASHPVAMPVISMNVQYNVTTAHPDPSKWRHSCDNYTGPAGYCMHGDIWVKWQDDIRTSWLENCVKARRDCHAFLIGGGRTTY